MANELSRRDALRLAAGAGLAMSFGVGSAVGVGLDKRIRLGFIGVGNRGTGLLGQLLRQAPEAQVPALCDIDKKALARGQEMVEKSRGKRPAGYGKGPRDYRRLLEREDVDAVLLAAPHEWHAPMAIDAMRAGKFVGCEVPACVTLEECRQLVRTQEQTKCGYMMLENYLYARPVMQVQAMVDQGLFGEITFASGAYIHELRAMRYKPDGSLTWRGENVVNSNGIIYPTHALGPIARWLGIGKTDKMKTLVAMSSRPAASHAWAVKKFGANSEQAKAQYKDGDRNLALITTEMGRLIEIAYDTSSPRPAGMNLHCLQGTRGAYDSTLGVYLEEKSPGEKWEALEKYREAYDHPRWKETEEAAKAGHGGGDYFVLADFLTAIGTGVSPIDVYEAAAWTCIRPLSASSIDAGSRPVDIPDFKTAAG